MPRKVGLGSVNYGGGRSLHRVAAAEEESSNQIGIGRYEAWDIRIWGQAHMMFAFDGTRGRGVPPTKAG